MSNPQIEFRPQPKMRRFQPLLPKHFRVEETQGETGTSREMSGKNAPLWSSRSAPGMQTNREKPPSVSVRSVTQDDLEHKMHALHLQKSRQYQELFQTEDQHRKKNSIQARLLSIQQHLEKLNQMGKKAKEMMTQENTLLEKFNRQLNPLFSAERLRINSEPPEICTYRPCGKMTCGDVSGVLCVLEFTDKVIAHLNFTKHRCVASVPFRLKTMEFEEIQSCVIPHLFLRTTRGEINLAFDRNYPDDHLTIAVALSGYPYPIVCLDIKEVEDDVLISSNDGELSLSLTMPAIKLNLRTRLKQLDGNARLKLQQSLQANLMVQQKGGVYSLLFKSYTYHLGRLVYRVIPRHGELFSMVVHPPRTQFGSNLHEKQICTARLQVKDEEATVTLVVDVLSDCLRLHFRWKSQEVLFCEEKDASLFNFLKDLQFVSAKESPITFLKSLETLKSIRPRVVLHSPPESG